MTPVLILISTLAVVLMGVFLGALPNPLRD